MVKRISYLFSKYLIDSVEKEDAIYKYVFQKTMDVINNFLKVLFTKTFVEQFDENVLYSKSDEYLSSRDSIESKTLRAMYEKAERVCIDITLHKTPGAITTFTDIFFFEKKNKRPIYKINIMVIKESTLEATSRILSSKV